MAREARYGPSESCKIRKVWAMGSIHLYRTLQNTVSTTMSSISSASYDCLPARFPEMLSLLQIESTCYASLTVSSPSNLHPQRCHSTGHKECHSLHDTIFSRVVWGVLGWDFQNGGNHLPAVGKLVHGSSNHFGTILCRDRLGGSRALLSMF